MMITKMATRNGEVAIVTDADKSEFKLILCADKETILRFEHNSRQLQSQILRKTAKM